MERVEHDSPAVADPAIQAKIERQRRVRPEDELRLPSGLVRCSDCLAKGPAPWE